MESLTNATADLSLASAASTPSASAASATPDLAASSSSAAASTTITSTNAALASEMASVTPALVVPPLPSKKPDSATAGHKFWSTQPVPQDFVTATELGKTGPIEVKTLADVRQKPLTLPEGFAWCELDWTKDEATNEAYVLLRDNYVEDDDAMFRFDYSKEFLQWALTPPDWKLEWQVGIRETNKNKLVAMITGTIASVAVMENNVPMAEINFLCVHKKLRSLRLAPVLIKEVTRRVNSLNIWQAVYTAGKEIPTPIGVARYWHRSLNIKKLLEIGFTSLGQRQTLARLTRLLALPETVSTPGWRKMKESDAARALPLIRGYLSRFKFHLNFNTEEEVRHWFTPRDGIFSSFVIEDASGKITDLASFYHLPSTVIRNPKHKTLRAAYSFYNVATTRTMEELLGDLLIEAKREDFDVFNALDLMENRPCFENLKFGTGDGNLHYYLYNYTVGARLGPEDVGVVLM